MSRQHSPHSLRSLRSRSPHPANPKPGLFLALFVLMPLALFAASGELPLPGLPSSKTRSSLLRQADRLLGTPYLYGGESPAGVDCSGYVQLVFSKATGKSIPRTVDQQSRWVLLIPRRELKAGDLVFFNTDDLRPLTPLATTAARLAAANHVGIYEGDNRFIHAASAGLKKGVTRNSLDEASWARRFLFAGRVVPASPLSGLAVEYGISAIFDAELIEGSISTDGSALELFNQVVRGAGLRLGVHIPLAPNFSIGLETRPEWDNLLSVGRIPLELVIGQTSGFSVFAGPALTLGTPALPDSSSGNTRPYEAVPGIIATGGVRWSPLLIRSGSFSMGIFTEFRADHYMPVPGQEDDQTANRRAVFSFSLGLRFRNVHY
jgi:hypothetical protein